MCCSTQLLQQNHLSCLYFAWFEFDFKSPPCPLQANSKMDEEELDEGVDNTPTRIHNQSTFFTNTVPHHLFLQAICSVYVPNNFYKNW